MSHSYVDMMADERWTEGMHTARTEAIVRSQVSEHRERILMRRFLGALLPEGHPLHHPMTPEQQMELGHAVGVFAQADLAGTDSRADAALLHAALDIEQAADDDRQALLDAAPPEVLVLLADREAHRAAMSQPPEELPPEVQP